MGTRRGVSRECTPGAVRWVIGRSVSVSQAAPDRALHGNVLHNQVKAHPSDPQQAFPGHGQMKPDAAQRIGCARSTSAHAAMSTNPCTAA